MGIGGILIWDVMIADICHEALILLLSSGVCYLTGIIFFILGEYKPMYHTIWPVFVVLAAAIHWFCIYFYIVNVSIGDSVMKEAVTDFVDSVSAAATVTASLVQSAKDMSGF